MKKRFKRIYVSMLALVMSGATLSPISVSAQDIYNENYFEAVYKMEFPQYDTHPDKEENSTLIQANLISAITGNPFIAYFNPETGRISSYYMDGTFIGVRYVADEAAFLELVETNAQSNRVTFDSFIRESGSLAEAFATLDNTELERSLATTTVFDPESGRVSLYDENDLLIGYSYGYSEEDFTNLIIAQNELMRLQLSELNSTSVEIGATYQEITPFNFDTGVVSITVPRGVDPRQDGAPVVPNWLATTANTESISLRTFAFPAGMSGMDYAIINDWGDFLRWSIDMPANAVRTYQVQFPGDRFAAFVNSFNGTFANVQLRFSASDAPAAPAQPTPPTVPQTATITFNVNGGSTSNSTVTRTVGQTLGNLPTPLRANHTFRGWYTTASGNTGQRVTSNTVVTGNATFFARWYSHRTRTLTHTGSASATGMVGSTVTSTVITFNGNTIPQNSVVESISVNAGGSTISGLIMPNMMYITAGVHRTNVPWNGTNNSVINTNNLNGRDPRTTWTIQWAGPVLSNTPGNLLNPAGTAAIRGFNNMRLTINYRVQL